jgi:hypothetical protein
MSAVACIYFQISLGKVDPQVLAFTLNRNTLRFFVVLGEKKTDGNDKEIWGVKYYHVKDRDLDLRVIGDSIRCLTLGKVLGNRNGSKVEELKQLRSMKLEGGEKMVRWWVEKEKKKGAKRSQPLEDSTEDDGKKGSGGKKDPQSDGKGGDDPDSGGGKKRKGEGGSDQSRSQYEGGMPKGKGGLGKGKTHLLSDVLRALARLAVSVI